MLYLSDNSQGNKRAPSLMSACLFLEVLPADEWTSAAAALISTGLTAVGMFTAPNTAGCARRRPGLAAGLHAMRTVPGLCHRHAALLPRPAAVRHGGGAQTLCGRAAACHSAAAVRSGKHVGASRLRWSRHGSCWLGGSCRGRRCCGRGGGRDDGRRTRAAEEPRGAPQRRRPQVAGWRRWWQCRCCLRSLGRQGWCCRRRRSRCNRRAKRPAPGEDPFLRIPRGAFDFASGCRLDRYGRRFSGRRCRRCHRRAVVLGGENKRQQRFWTRAGSGGIGGRRCGSHRRSRWRLRQW
ncbi:unnamed protein product [Phaeothamnion confervicola]